MFIITRKFTVDEMLPTVSPSRGLVTFLSLDVMLFIMISGTHLWGVLTVLFSQEHFFAFSIIRKFTTDEMPTVSHSR